MYIMIAIDTGWSIKKGNPLLAVILSYFLEVINFSVYKFGKFRLFYVSGEEIVGKKCPNESATLI